MSFEFIKLEDIINDEDTVKIVKEYMIERVAKIRTGKVIRKKYAEGTKRQRRRFGLQTNFVDLTGSQSYDNRARRLLNDWNIFLLESFRSVVRFNTTESAVIYAYQIRRYGKII